MRDTFREQERAPSSRCQYRQFGWRQLTLDHVGKRQFLPDHASDRNKVSSSEVQHIAKCIPKDFEGRLAREQELVSDVGRKCRLALDAKTKTRSEIARARQIKTRRFQMVSSPDLCFTHHFSVSTERDSDTRARSCPQTRFVKKICRGARVFKLSVHTSQGQRPSLTVRLPIPHR